MLCVRLKKVSIAFYTLDVLIKNIVKRYRVFFYYFFRLVKMDYIKEKLDEVTFKLFPNSLKMKILPSELDSFTLVKVL